MTNNQPWQAVVNTNNFIKAEQTANLLSVVKHETPAAKQSKTITKVVLAKRYSIDDNGGGYQGL